MPLPHNAVGTEMSYVPRHRREALKTIRVKVEKKNDKL